MNLSVKNVDNFSFSTNTKSSENASVEKGQYTSSFQWLDEEWKTDVMLISKYLLWQELF